MNKIVNKFWLTGYKFLPEFYLRQPGMIVDHLLNSVKQFKDDLYNV